MKRVDADHADCYDKTYVNGEMIRRMYLFLPFPHFSHYLIS